MPNLYAEKECDYNAGSVVVQQGAAGKYATVAAKYSTMAKM